MKNSWLDRVYPDSQPQTRHLLDKLSLDTGNPALDAVIESVTCLCRPELAALMERRDAALREHAGPHKLEDPKLELLSAVSYRLG